MPKCQKIKKGGLEQYGPGRFKRLIFATVKKCGNEKVNTNEAQSKEFQLHAASKYKHSESTVTSMT